MTELAGPVSAARTDPTEVVEQFRALPADRYPRLIEIAGAAGSSTPETEFRRGLTALLDGLASPTGAARPAGG